MYPGVVRSRAAFPALRIILIAGLTVMLAGWTTCSALFISCQTSAPQPQITTLSPNAIPGDMEFVTLTVEGSEFVPQSQVLWNGTALPTTFIDSSHLQAAITPQTLASFGSSSGSTVKISVRSEDLQPVMGCPIGGNSAVLILTIN